MSNILVTKIDTDCTNVSTTQILGLPHRRTNINRIFAVVQTADPDGSLEVNLTDEEIELFLALTSRIAARVKVEVAA